MEGDATKQEPTIVKTSKRVESQCGRFLDTGSIPVASTNYLVYCRGTLGYLFLISFCDKYKGDFLIMTENNYIHTAIKKCAYGIIVQTLSIPLVPMATLSTYYVRSHIGKVIVGIIVATLILSGIISNIVTCKKYKHIKECKDLSILGIVLGISNITYNTTIMILLDTFILYIFGCPVH